jgi:hypothetical protein
VILLGGRSLRQALNDSSNIIMPGGSPGKRVVLFPRDTDICREPQPVQCRGDWVGSCAIIIRAT